MPDAKVDRSDHPDSLSTVARKSLDRHGHGFHYAVAKALRDTPSRWRVEAVEFPVELHGTPLHIDIVLRSLRAVMVIECKRANPALASWCFARSTHVSVNTWSPSKVALEQLFVPPAELGHFHLMTTRDENNELSTPHQFHVCQELRTGEKGDGHGGRSAFDEALTQAIRGASGLTEAYAALQRPAELMEANSLFVVPVIVTTARLLCLSTDLAEASLDSGNLPSGATVTERPWVWFRLMTSSHVRHAVPRFEPDSQPILRSLGGLAQRDYARSVGVVSVAGLAEFLRIASHHVHEHI